MTDEIQLTYSISSFCETQKCFSVKIYSPKFKNPPESYPTYNISINNIDFTKDVKDEISKQCLNIAQQILFHENEDLLKAAKAFVQTNQNIELLAAAVNDNAAVSLIKPDLTDISHSSVSTFEIVN